MSFYSGIAKEGYNVHSTPPNIAFLPGMPMLIGTAHSVGIDWVEAGLLISFIAGLFVAVGLSRLTELYAPGLGDLSVLFIASAPTTIFLTAGYPESSFLALAIWCWIFAKQQRWWLAGVLAAASFLFRVNGLFLAVALCVLWVGHPGKKRFGDLLALGLPLVALFGWVLFLHSLSGDWFAWQHAQLEGWRREFVGPIASLQASWAAAFHFEGHPEFYWYDANYAWMARAELVAMLIGLLVTIRLLWLRFWAEAVYCFLPLFALGTSTWYFSVPRSLIVSWPIYMLLARESRRRPWLVKLWMAVCAPLAGLFAAAFLVKRWAG